MRTWLRAHNNAVALSVISFGIFFIRVALDFRYVFDDPSVFPQDVGTMAGAMLLYASIFSAWLWAHIVAERGGLRAWLGIAFLNGLAFLQAISTTLVFCPAPCETAWPLAEVVNWATLIASFIAASGAIIQSRK